MAKGRPPDPGRAGRGTGHRALVGKAKPIEVMPAFELDLEPPAGIPDEAHELWRCACAELKPRGLNAGDLPLVEMLVVAAHRHRQACDVVARAGLFFKTQGGPIVNPMLKVEKETAATYLRLAETIRRDGRLESIPFVVRRETPAGEVRFETMLVTARARRHLCSL